jgi:hypothetical protein
LTVPSLPRHPLLQPINREPRGGVERHRVVLRARREQDGDRDVANLGVAAKLSLSSSKL